ncbi:hypothetical protein GCM10011611_02350 [Aliidongia dinghuensis]|uniref:HEAT repeat domain-containing protein n=1 Tax=Aliidongia dinghuensis TaxID=1867774 RepID=A0A8J2YP16_9PROT|nr:hypothetical protein [Aliidongia dinghuensis]GGF00258.1 hypothetical protein GCM10011611_02350 [Aliidongia dinghuensis]
MKKPDEVAAKLGEAYVDQSVRPEKVSEALEALAECGGSRDLPVVLAFVWGTVRFPRRSGTGEIGAAAVMRRLASRLRIADRPRRRHSSSLDVEAVALDCAVRLLRRIPPYAVPELDRVSRSATGSIGAFQDGAKQWHWTAAPRPEDVPTGPARSALLGLLSANANGWTREAAVAELAKCSDGDEIPFLLWRMADWVEPVRLRAEAAVVDRLKPALGSRFAAALHLVRRLEGMRRVDLAEIVSRIHALLLDEPDRPSLNAALRSDDRYVRREACRVLDRGREVPNREIRRIVGSDRDAVVRGWLLGWEVRLRDVDAEAAQTLRRRLLTDPSSGIRAQALLAVADLDIDERTDALLRALFDPAAMVRHIARFHLKQDGHQADFVDAYRAILDSGKGPLVVAVAGFGETAKRVEWVRLLLFLEGPAGLARVALKAMAQLDGDAAQHVFLECLADPRDGVCRQAYRLLRRRLDNVDADRLSELWRRAPSDVSRVVLAKAMLRLPPWTALGVLLEATSAGAEPRPEIISALEAWRPEHRKHYAPDRLSDVARARLHDAVRSVGGKLPLAVTARLETLLS